MAVHHCKGSGNQNIIIPQIMSQPVSSQIKTLDPPSPPVKYVYIYISTVSLASRGNNPIYIKYIGHIKK